MDGKVMCATLDHFGGVLPKISQVLAIKFHACPLKQKKINNNNKNTKNNNKTNKNKGWPNNPPQKLKGGGSVTPKIEKEGG
jgi:hypothetical protein